MEKYEMMDDDSNWQGLFFCEGYAASHQAIDDAILFPDG